MGDFGFGNSKFEYGSNESKTDISGGSLEFEYGHYIIPYLALGAEINWASQVAKQGSSKDKSSSILFTPMLTGNLPVENCWNNLFLQTGYGFGQEKTVSGFGTNKENITTFCVNLGFNDFFGKHISFTPKIGYEWETFKDPDTDIKEKWSGIEFSAGVSLHF